MFRRTSFLTFTFALVAVVACSKKDKAAPPSTGSATGSAADTAGSGSAMTGSATDSSGSAMAGSGSGSDAGSAGSADAGSAAAGSGAAAAGSGAETEFEKLSHEDKVKFMKTKVMPVMKVAFQKFDPKEFAKFTCKTCHGKDPEKSKHEMPTKDLPKLDFEALKKGDEKEEVEFMETVVKPQMAKILGEHEMTQAEPHGFGCLSCHTQKK